ncbi:MAG: Crp/Fnr family transcriptional regulator [Clostridia bacterium]|nr:Crp/Fnr family transcriptional regulator [Clostridia bacterium]
MYVLTSGRATVYSVCGGSDFVLRTMRSGDTLGAAALFSAHGEMTRVIADEPTRVLCIPEQAVRRLIARDPDFALRYITFLSDRIRFLNKRLACLSAGSAAARLAAWLDTTVPEGCTDYDLTIPLSRLCSVLDLGRASLYRALDELETGGWLSRSGKHLILPDRAGMARAYGLD